MKEYLTFQKFITPIFVQVLFWLGILGLLIFVVAGDGGGPYGGGMPFFMRILVFIFGAIFWRVYMELILVLFGIYREIRELKDVTKGNQVPDTFN